MGVAYRRKVVLPLVSVLGAGLLALAVGSMELSSASDSSSGIQLVASDGQGATLSVTEIEPGDTIVRTVTIRNDADVSSRLSFAEDAEPATFDNGRLELTISRDGQQLYAGQFGAMSDFAQDMGYLEPQEETTFTFTVSLPSDAPFVRPGTETATANYTWLTSRA